MKFKDILIRVILSFTLALFANLILSSCGGGSRVLVSALTHPTCNQSPFRLCGTQSIAAVENMIYAPGRGAVYKIFPESEKMSIVATIPANLDITGFSGITGTETHLYLTDDLENVIIKVKIVSGEMTIFSGSGNRGWKDGSAVEADFDMPRNIVTNSQFLYVWDEYKVRKIDIKTGEVSTLAGSNEKGDKDGLGGEAKFSYSYLTLAKKFLYAVKRSSSNRIRIINIDTGEVTSLYIKTPDGNPGKIQGRVTKLGNFLYISNHSDHIIQKVNIHTGIVTTLAGKKEWRNWGWRDGIGSEAKFWNPQGITNDGRYLYVADTNNNVIRKVDPETGEVTTIAKLKEMLENDEL